MVKFDYSLDVGESIKTDEVLKEKAKEAPNCGCGAPKKIVKLSDEDKIKDQEEDIKEKEQETVEEEQLENVPETEKKEEPEKEEKEEKVEIKPISFEKAKLVSDFTEEPKKDAEETKKSAEEPTVTEDTEEEIEKPEEEDEKDVNEFLDDSFSKEAKKYEQFNNNKTKVTVEEPVKRSIWPIILLIILIGAAAFMYGYAVFKEPTDIAIVPEIVNTVQPIEPIIEVQNITENTTLPEKPVIEEPDNKTIDQALELFTAGLKD
ncbi:hypothetical protein KY333_00770 [Candidatus Woesearchaeota archaeon]|nr:hypothetical protein [Candidatus Woesearchaeota archaeon]MBW2994602.1 hypothetical protein [Candidatus Woesearchaeota archaeon]